MNIPLFSFHSPFVRRSNRTGFTLIEILVATTILLIIVVLASLVFQQTTGAYQTGERKVNAQVALRNVLGTMTRDLALAVDSYDYPGVNNSFGEYNLSFVALTGTPGKDAQGKEVRTARFIEYSSDGTRKETIMTCGRGKNGQPTWSANGQTIRTELYDKDSYDDVDGFKIKFDYDGPSELPTRVYVRVEFKGGGQTTAVGAGSGGRRGWESPDEIWVGVKPD